MTNRILNFTGQKRDGKGQKEPGGQAGLGIERGNEGGMRGNRRVAVRWRVEGLEGAGSREKEEGS